MEMGIQGSWERMKIIDYEEVIPDLPILRKLDTCCKSPSFNYSQIIWSSDFTRSSPKIKCIKVRSHSFKCPSPIVV
jgi:hypothetical protein